MLSEQQVVKNAIDGNIREITMKNKYKEYVFFLYSSSPWHYKYHTFTYKVEVYHF